MILAVCMWQEHEKLAQCTCIQLLQECPISQGTSTLTVTVTAPSPLLQLCRRDLDQPGLQKRIQVTKQRTNQLKYVNPQYSKQLKTSIISSNLRYIFSGVRQLLTATPTTAGVWSAVMKMHRTSTLNTAQWISAISQYTHARVIQGLARGAISWVAAMIDEIYFVSQGLRI